MIPPTKYLESLGIYGSRLVNSENVPLAKKLGAENYKKIVKYCLEDVLDFTKFDESKLTSAFADFGISTKWITIFKHILARQETEDQFLLD